MAELRQLEVNARGINKRDSAETLQISIPTYFPTVSSVNSRISFATVKIDVPAPRTKSGDLMVESADIELIIRDLLDTCVALVSAPSQSG